MFIVTLIIPEEQLLFLTGALSLTVHNNRHAHPAFSLRAYRQLCVPNTICKLIHRHTMAGKHISYQQAFSFIQAADF